MRILVCGGRDYHKIAIAFDALDSVKPTHIISGGARGADDLAVRWAVDREIPFTVYPAQWKKHGNKAGPIRNQQMLDEGKPDHVIAFPGGAGTKDMVARSRAAFLPVWEVE